MCFPHPSTASMLSAHLSHRNLCGSSFCVADGACLYIVQAKGAGGGEKGAIVLNSGGH
jgi:hypothetical protein